MKIAPARIDAFVASPPSSLRIALIFGPDHGAVKLRADKLAKGVVANLDDPFRVSVLASDEISGDPARLYDEFSAQALGGGRRLLRVPQAEEKIAATLTKILADFPPTDALLILEAGELDKRSKLRALAESDNELIAALACYPEEGAERTRLISDWLRERGHKIAPDALGLLSSITPPDRLGLFSELEKMTLYSGSETISLEDVQAALGDAAGVDLETMVMAVGDGDRALLDVTLRRLASETTAPVAMLRAGQRHFNRLLETRVRLDSGMNVKDAMAKLQPRVFWKAEAQFSRQVQRWNQPKLLRALAALVEAEAQCKRGGTPDQVLCQQLFMNLSRAG